MITRVAKAKAVFPKSAAADDALEPHEFFFASGNSCVIEPVMRKDPEDPGKCFIAVTYYWRSSPAKADKDELEGEVRRMSGLPPVFQHEAQNLREAGRMRDEFLKTKSLKDFGSAQPEDGRHEAHAGMTREQMLLRHMGGEMRREIWIEWGGSDESRMRPLG